VRLPRRLILRLYSRGRWRFARPVESVENSEVEELCDLAEERIASRIFVSSFFAIISAAFPLGALINGTWPAVDLITTWELIGPQKILTCRGHGTE